jgi:phosphotransferase system enzyme I (PtsI)
VQLKPDQESIDEFLERRRRLDQRQEVLAAHASVPAITTDGHRVAVGVNVASLLDLSTFPVEQCDGVGLLRTEFLYMERNEFPSEEEQFRLYRRIVEHLEGRPLTLRTLDIGGDKTLPYFQTPQEENPALGWRGLRITLEWQDLLRVQLRAAMRASVAGPVQIMLPMVTSIEEVRRARQVFDGVRKQLLDQGYELAQELPLGIMVEVPSCVWALPEIVREVDFVSVGTNDLVQYILAVDRDNSFVSRIYDPAHPAVVRALQHIGEVCQAAGKRCGVCGEIAGDHGFVLMLLGMGFDSLSSAPHFLPEIRYAVRSSSLAEARALAQAAVQATDSAQVHELLSHTRDRLHARLVDQH